MCVAYIAHCESLHGPSYLKGVASALLFQRLLVKNLPYKSLSVVNSVLRVDVSQLLAFVSDVYARLREGHHAGDAFSTLLVSDHLYVPGPRLEYSH